MIQKIKNEILQKMLSVLDNAQLEQLSAILDIAFFGVENNILSTYKIVNYLQGFISLRKNNKNMESAIDKWKEDINFVLNYRKSNRNIRVDNIIVYYPK